MAVIRVGDLHHRDIARIVPGRDRGIVEREVQEVHRARLARGAGALDILFGHGGNADGADGQEDMLLDPAYRAQERVAPLGILDLEHQRRGQLAAIGHHRVIGCQFVGQLLLAALLNAQHLLDLQPHAVPAFEGNHRMRADRQAREFLGQDAFLALVLADQLVIGEVHDVLAGDGTAVPGHRLFHIR